MSISKPDETPQRPAGKSRTVKVLLAVSILYGVAAGIYEFVLPFYLKEQNLSFENMGLIFGVAAGAMFVLKLASGQLADKWGSKQVYLLALISNAVAALITPLTARLAGLTILKACRDIGHQMRETVHPILLFADSRTQFRDSIGKTRGAEFLFQAGGTLLAGVTMAGITVGGAVLFALGSEGSLILAGMIFLIACVLLAFGVAGRADGKTSNSDGGSFWRWDLAPNLKVIMLSNFIFSIGLSTSHCFIMPLFFSQKFGVSHGAVAAVMVIHRVTIALPMLFAARIPCRNPKLVYIFAIVAEGATITLGGVLPGFILASSVWLLHDLLGAGVWIPIQSEIIQQHCREDSRGLDLSKTLAFSALGFAIGPFLAGWLAEWSISAPFVVSGILVMLSAVVLMKLSLPVETR